MKCHQTDCPNLPEFRYYWPGHGEALICGEHVGWLVVISEAMGLKLPVFRIEPEEFAKFVAARLEGEE